MCVWDAAASRHCLRLIFPGSPRSALGCAISWQRALTAATLTRSQAHPCQPPPHLRAISSCNTALVGLAERFTAYLSWYLVLAPHTTQNTLLLPEQGFLSFLFFESFALHHTRNTQISWKKKSLYAVPSLLCLTTLSVCFEIRGNSSQERRVWSLSRHQEHSWPLSDGDSDFAVCLFETGPWDIYTLFFFYHEVTVYLLLSGDQVPSQHKPVLGE